MRALTRREYLKNTGVLSTAAALASLRWMEQECGATAPIGKFPVVDTHLHCFAGVKDTRFPYHARAPYRPETPATPEHLLRCMGDAGIDRAVVVHPEPYQDDHRYLEHCLEVGGKQLKGICLFFADRPESLKKMPGFLNRMEGRILATRIHAYAPGRLPPFGKTELRQLWQIAADHDVAVQLHFEPRYAPGFAQYLKEFQDVRVIIDHMGRPMQGTPKEHEVVLKWADRANTIMKISAIPDQNKYPHREVAPVLRRIVSAFGSDRLIYGGGFNAAANGPSYRMYRDNIRSLLDGVDGVDFGKLYGGNAYRMFFA